MVRGDQVAPAPRARDLEVGGQPAALGDLEVRAAAPAAVERRRAPAQVQGPAPRHGHDALRAGRGSVRSRNQAGRMENSMRQRSEQKT